MGIYVLKKVIRKVQQDAPGTYGEKYGSDLQRHMLAVLARTPGSIIRYRSALDPAFFVAESHRVVAEVLLDHVDKYRSLPTKTLLVEDAKAVCDDAMFNNISKLVESLYSEDISDSEAIQDRLVQFGKQQALINAVLTSADLIEKGDTNILPHIQKALMVGEDLLDIGVDYNDLESERYEWYMSGDTTNEIVPTGVTHLDNALRGGLARGELGVVLGPPKRGKSTTLINFAFGALVSGFNVVYYTLEMPEKKVMRRLDDRLAGGKIGMKYQDPELYVKMLKSRNKAFIRGKLFVKGYRSRSASVSTIRSHLSMLAARGFRPGLVIVDYADIMRPESRIGEYRHEQAGIYEDLRSLSQEFDVALWTASQTNRSGTEKEIVTITDFGESFEKAAIADTVVAFCQSLDEKARDVCRIFLAALRDQGDGRTIKCDIKRDRCSIISTSIVNMTAKSAPKKGSDENASTKDKVMDVVKDAKPKYNKAKFNKKGGGPKKAKFNKPSKKVNVR